MDIESVQKKTKIYLENLVEGNMFIYDNAVWQLEKSRYENSDSAKVRCLSSAIRGRYSNGKYYLLARDTEIEKF